MWGALLVVTMMEKGPNGIQWKGAKGAKCPQVCGKVAYMNGLPHGLQLFKGCSGICAGESLLTLIWTWNLTLFPCFSYKHQVFFCFNTLFSGM